MIDVLFIFGQLQRHQLWRWLQLMGPPRPAVAHFDQVAHQVEKLLAVGQLVDLVGRRVGAFELPFAVELAGDLRILEPTLAQLVLAAMVLSMLSAPLLIHYSDRIVRKFTANDWLARAAQITKIAATTMARQNHVIICGYGRSGQNLARLLDAE